MEKVKKLPYGYRGKLGLIVVGPNPTPVQKAYDVAMEAFVPGTDGIFIPCTTFRSIDVIEKIEKETGVPVITSNQASLWECLRIIGNDELVEGYGKLLRIPNRSQFKGLPR